MNASSRARPEGATARLPGPGIQRGKDRFRALPGCGYRGIDIHVVLPERVHPGVLTARRADDAIAALPFPLLGDGQRTVHSQYAWLALSIAIPSGPGTTSNAGCPSTVTGNQLNPAATRPPTAKNRLLCDARKVSMPVTWRGPGHSSCSAAAMLDLPEQLVPFSTMQAAVIPQGCLNTHASRRRRRTRSTGCSALRPGPALRAVTGRQEPPPAREPGTRRR